MKTSIEQNILNFVTRSNWVLFFCLALPGAIYLDPRLVAGFICGALIVTINFHLLTRTLKNAFIPGRVVSKMGAATARAVVAGIFGGAATPCRLPH